MAKKHRGRERSPSECRTGGPVRASRTHRRLPSRSRRLTFTEPSLAAAHCRSPSKSRVSGIPRRWACSGLGCASRGMDINLRRKLLHVIRHAYKASHTRSSVKVRPPRRMLEISERKRKQSRNLCLFKTAQLGFCTAHGARRTAPSSTRLIPLSGSPSDHFLRTCRTFFTSATTAPLSSLTSTMNSGSIFSCTVNA
jgi:hypothetical protein